MKKSIFLSFILCLCLITCIPQVMAQKQSRMEKVAQVSERQRRRQMAEEPRKAG